MGTTHMSSWKQYTVLIINSCTHVATYALWHMMYVMCSEHWVCSLYIRTCCQTYIYSYTYCISIYVYVYVICITLVLIDWDLSTLCMFVESTHFFHINAFRDEVNPQFFKMLQKKKKTIQSQIKFSSLLKTVFYVVQ